MEEKRKTDSKGTYILFEKNDSDKMNNIMEKINFKMGEVIIDDIEEEFENYGPNFTGFKIIDDEDDVKAVLKATFGCSLEPILAYDEECYKINLNIENISD